MKEPGDVVTGDGLMSRHEQQARPHPCSLPSCPPSAGKLMDPPFCTEFENEGWMGSVAREAMAHAPFYIEYVSVEPQFPRNILWQESPFTSTSPSQPLCDSVNGTEEGIGVLGVTQHTSLSSIQKKPKLNLGIFSTL